MVRKIFVFYVYLTIISVHFTLLNHCLLYMLLVTAVNRKKRSVLLDFIADHPFLFLVSHVRGCSLFIGHVLKPSFSVDDSSRNKIVDEL